MRERPSASMASCSWRCSSRPPGIFDIVADGNAHTCAITGTAFGTS